MSLRLGLSRLPAFGCVLLVCGAFPPLAEESFVLTGKYILKSPVTCAHALSRDIRRELGTGSPPKAGNGRRDPG